MNKCELTPVAAHLAHLGASCLIFDLRAHGRSGGRKSGFGYPERMDVANAVAYARKRRPDAKIGLIGSSMGSAAIAFALKDDPEALPMPSFSIAATPVCPARFWAGGDSSVASR